MYEILSYLVFVGLIFKFKTLLGNSGRVVGNYLHIVHVWEKAGYELETLI